MKPNVANSSNDPVGYARVQWGPWEGPLAEWIDEILTEQGFRFLSEVPSASHLTDDSPLNDKYYIRHRIETVWRIWLTARTDAIALSHMITEDYESARSWSKYVAEELDHDRLFLSDLSVHGITREKVRACGPFPVTRDMVDFIDKSMAEYRSLPAVAYSLFVEWNSERFSLGAVEKAEAAFSEQHVAGSKSHVGIDLAESHLPMMLGITDRLISRDHSRADLEQLLRRIAAYFRGCFQKLHDETRLPVDA